ncbi:DUF4254 domain-containing protein [Nocardia vermiculata]|uniref:DUF4254 domain-containing protein n=1 Tax=Nocardia vermiculata TaxID=257274 RepID=A0A846Y0S2_9NOCA|nr:DUF4254 domain-containing protein [Nocardia vermiculata]NKY53076.1 DUF4254 domain-containing protein [Nocardia vermiculata]
METAYAGDNDTTGTLPSAPELLHAFRSTPAPGEHPVLDSARCLVRCHEQRRLAYRDAHAPQVTSVRSAGSNRLVDEADRERAALVEGIDLWVADNISHRAGASLHTETLGAVIDRMAGKWVAAHHALGLPHSIQPLEEVPAVEADGEAHLQWARLAELADGYTDLVTDIAEHRRRLPVF